MDAVTDNPPDGPRSGWRSAGTALLRKGADPGLRLLAQRPLSAVAGALALGFLAGRLMR